MHTLSDEQTTALGFDALVGFEPHSRTMLRQSALGYARNFVPRAINYLLRRLKLTDRISELAVMNRFDYRALARTAMAAERSSQRLFPCVIPSWDNSARRSSGATVIQNNDPRLFEAWLRDAASRVVDYPQEEQLVFINAWNEWAEGCHLEPDLRNGKSFLEAVRRVFGQVPEGTEMLAEMTAGDNSDYYSHIRGEIAQLLPADIGRVLEIGCGRGDTLAVEESRQYTEHLWHRAVRRLCRCGQKQGRSCALWRF